MPLPSYRVQWMPGASPFDVAADFYLLLPGSGNASTPDHANFAITDLHFRCELTFDNLPPPQTTTFAQQYDGPTNQRSWLLALNPQGRLVVQWSTDGTSTGTHAHTLTAALPVGTGRTAIGIKFDVDDGAGNHAVTFETAPALVGPWTDMSTQTFAGATSLFNSTQPLLVRSGSVSSGTTIRIHKAELRAAIGGAVVANPNFTAQTPGTTNFNDTAPTPKPWTITAPATIAGFDWVAIPDDHIKSLRWTTGRDNELDQFRTGSATVVFRNNDRRYDPEHTTGPHFGNLLPRVPFRIQLSTDGINWQDQFYGFVKGGWQQTYFKPKASTCTVELEDLLGVLESEELPGSAWEAEVLGNSPMAFWRLDERTGVQMADSSGNARHGFIDNGTLGDEALVRGDGAAFNVPHVGDNRGRIKGEGLPTSAPCSLVAWVKTPRDLAATKSIIVAQRDSSLGSALWLQIETSGGGSPNGELVINFLGLGTFYKARGSRRIDDDQPHMVTCTIDTLAVADVLLYVDGVAQTKTTISGTNPGAWTSHLVWTVGNTIDTSQGDFGLDGILDEVAIFDVTLSPSQISDLYAAGSTGFDGEPTGDRVDRVLDTVGLPAALRDIATGDTTVGSADYARRSAASYLQGVVESEQGVLYVNHNNAGKLTFRGRYDRLTATRSTTSQTTFTPSHFREDVAPEPNGIDTVVNIAEVTWQGGTETVVDTASKAQYGAQRRSLTTEAPTPSAAQSAGGWLVARYKDPQTRLRRLPFNLAGKPELWDTILDLQISDRTTVTRHPQKVGAQITNSLILEGTDFALSEDLSWVVDYRLSNADDTTVWVWGTSTWGETTSWG